METIEVTRVDEQAAQRLADATGRVTYLNFPVQGGPDRILLARARMTTDRDEAVGWGESVAFVPRPEHWCATCRGYHRDKELHLDEMQNKIERTLGEQQAGDHYERPLADYANKTFVVPEGAVGVTGYPFHWVKKDGSEEPFGEPEPQLRVVRVLEYRGPQKAIELMLAKSKVSQTIPLHMPTYRMVKDEPTRDMVEVVEVIRTTERLCRWCGGEHLGACSEDECSANERKGRY